MKTLSIEELQFYGYVLYGESWHSSLAVALAVTEQQLDEWLSSDQYLCEHKTNNTIPEYVFFEIKELLNRRACEINQATSLINSCEDRASFLEKTKLLYDVNIDCLPNELSIETIDLFLDSLEQDILYVIKKRITNKDAFKREEAIEYAEIEFTNNCDIHGYIENNKITVIGKIEEIENHIANKLTTLKDKINKIYDR